jgi:hypothetical protein
VNAQYGWSLGLANEKWRLKRGSQYSVRYWIDAGDPDYAMAVATSESAVEVVLKDSVPLFNNFRRGNTLYFSAQNMDFMFSLTDTSRVLTYLLDCVKGGGRKPIAVAATPNPFGPTTAPTTSRDKGSSSSNASLAAERAEATVLAANLLSELGTPGFKILQPDEMPAGWKSDAMWRSDAGLGTVDVLPKVADPAEMSAVIISGDAKSCKKAFASGSLPAGEGSLTRLFTRCGAGKDALVGIYLVVPRRAGGIYVVGTFSLGEEDAGKALDASIRQAIFRALPK